MWVIEKIRIKNFRSIVYGEIEPAEVTVIVGENDVGKSNYLRALNLFFNNETDIGRPFDFSADFSQHAVVGKGKARQIEIDLYIHPPENFSDTGTILWKRYWREESSTFVSESFHRLPGRKEIALRSKVIQWLRNIRFRYVPAIKGNDYFTSLLRDLHDVLAETVDKELRAAARDFIGVVRGHTAGISKHLVDSINIQSRLELPPNLRSLFEVLDFTTASGASDISLRLRGDGIKVRHIPAILSFLADQERRLASPGRPKPTAIWGYEEPENNLEMRKAFEHAEELLGAKDLAQIFITTHSPAFYGLATQEKDGVMAFSAVPHAEKGTQLHPVMPKDVSIFDEELGMMPLIAPYIAEKVAEISDLKNKFEKVKSDIEATSRPIILLAGETDVEYIKCALNCFSGQANEIDTYCVGVKTGAGSMGTGDPKLLALIEQLRLRPELIHRPIVAVLDCDVSKAPQSFNRLDVYQLKKNTSNSIADRGIENLLPEEVFLDDFYDVKVKELPYNGKTETKTLNKTALCNAICMPGGKFFSNRKTIMSNFDSVVADILALLNSKLPL